MDREAETMFDDIASRYESNFAHDIGLNNTLDQVLFMLPARSRILDIGCGTGRPVSFRMATAGHEVTGIDISQHMIDIASRQVPGARFEKTDMTIFEPRTKYDAILAIFSLFNLSKAQVVAMITKFGQWLRPGGIFVLGTIPSTTLFQDASLYDSSEHWVDGKPMYFMGHEFHGTAATGSGWRELLEHTNFLIKADVSGIFTPPDPMAHRKDPEHQYLVCERRA